MKILESLEDTWENNKPAVLTIGTFDGVHLGHKKVIQKVVEAATAIHGKSVVITFRNHPLQVLNPEKSIKFICTPLHKAKLIEEMDVDLLYYLQFTKAFSEQNAEDFLTTISKKQNFKKLILGYDARIGRGREGDKNKVLELSRKMHFEALHLDPLILEEKPVSSSAIRQAIQKGDFKTAETFLGRPYSILGLVVQGKQLGKKLGFPTANLDVSDLCLPPFGVYAVDAEVDGKRCSAIANVGIAPTIREDRNPLLEVYLFEKAADLYGKELEVFFKKFLRPEMQFKNEEELRQQIEKDIEKAKRVSTKS